MEELSHHDDVSVQMQKMLQATNEIVKLTNDLIEAGKVLNQAKGFYREIQARIKAQKEIINSCKVVIRAENQYGS